MQKTIQKQKKQNILKTQQTILQHEEKDILYQININTKVLVYLCSSLCSPCRLSDFFINELKEKIKKEKINLKIIKIDIDKNKNFADMFDIYTIPAFLFFCNGKLKKSFSGLYKINLFFENILCENKKD
jgi:thioredoxin-like negative regulator of GroEL